MNRVDAWLHRARQTAAAVWPPHCVLCGRLGMTPDIDLCQGCERELPVNRYFCAICAAPFQFETHGERMCGACLSRAPRYDSSRIPFRFSYPLDHMIRRLKYGGAVAVGRVLGELFARRVAIEELPQALLPVPLAHRRFCERGYNQAIVIAEHVGAKLHLPVRADLIVRTRDTLEQAGLDQRARRRNIRRAFAVMAAPPPHVAIFDDVVTTGSTVNEIARVLKRAGAKRVEVWAIARAGR